MNWKFFRKRLAAACVMGVLCLGSLTGCQGDTKVVFTTGLSGNQLFKIGSSICRLPEAMIYLTTFYEQYADTYGAEMWNYDFGGVSLEEHVKEVVLSKLTQIKIMNLMAEERKIELTPEEEERVLEASRHYYDLLEEELKKEENITLETAETVYREYALANKVYTTITEAADMEISDDEARTIQAQVIFLKNENREDAKKALDRILSGEEFETVAAQVSEEKQLLWNYARGDVDAEFEEILFALDEGEVSGLVETSEGVYIVKCIRTMDYEATQENKTVLAEKRKQEAFSKAYQEIAIGTHSQFRDKMWEKLTLDQTFYRTDANFFEIYEQYVKQ